MSGVKYDENKPALQFLGLTETWWSPSSRDGRFKDAFEASQTLDEFWIKGHNTPEILVKTLDCIRRLASLESYDLRFEIGIAKVREFGAKKYGFLNYRLGMNWGRLVGAIRRHLYWYPVICMEELDKETKLPHWTGAACTAGFLYEYIKDGLGTDDRTTSVTTKPNTPESKL